MTQDDDIELAKLAAHGDRLAFTALLARHYDFITRVAYRWCGNTEDAEDIAQDVCVKLGTAIASFKGRSAFTSWLYRLTTNTAHDRQRKATRATQKHQAMSITNEPIQLGEPEHDLSLQQLWQKVHTLPAQQRDAVLLVFGEDLSHRDAGEILGCKESTVSWHLHEAKKRLKQEFEGALP